ncbi:MAG: cell division protein FtsL [Chromatiaceae bacterium]|nr:cell division protein FtsL [Gammaproteobacteria bacterium]MCB1863137.1 cell division protein FtsL [Gammaproteobacteria bacterium]MCB1870522.1 cell division protein FtsL [Gammaproteobacteria bacterium]MCP5427343.1 cell division protein FtsL [Chromatiaceae bacterium]MCP5447820.1 cell division protein FtsL [Chromatiaceae bacterium]
MNLRQLLVIVFLGAAVLLTSIGVVHAKYSSRKYFVELQKLRLQQDELDVEWGRLQLEQSTWATEHRVESIARGKLNMRIPSAEEVMVIKP